MSEKRDYYEVLSLSREATGDEVRKAYRREALKHHPDRNPGDAQAEERFKEVNEAYQVLSDDEKRSIYDQFGHEGLQGGGFQDAGDVFSHMQDLFAEMFSGGGFGGGRRQARGGDLRVQETLNLADAAFGLKREITLRAPAACDDCNGSGAKAGTKPEVCGNCRGTGHVSNARGFVMFTTPCQKCGGNGTTIRHPCASCAGRGAVHKERRVTVAFPAGVDSGTRLRVPGQGLPGPPGAPPGDLYVDIEVEDDPRFERDGSDLITRAQVTFAQAALGAEIEVPALGDGSKKISSTKITIPAGTQPNTVIQLKGQGIPRLDGRGRGSLVAVVQVSIPTSLSPRARELITELAAELDPEEAPARVAAGK